MFEFDIKSNAADAALVLLKEENGIYEYNLACTQAEDEVTLITHIPCINCFTVWNPSVELDRQLRPEWYSSKCRSSVLKWAPCHQLIGQDDKNILTIAVSDVKNTIEIKTGIREENASVTCKIVFRLQECDIPYKAVIRLDTRDIPCYESIYDVSLWWDELGFVSAPVPENARMPVYSSWYSFHQMLSPDEIIKECALAKELGMDTIILDDGWQTEDMQRGYAYCGDWEYAPSKVGDMKKLADRVHGMDMKIMLWYNIAFMGDYAKMSGEFEGMYMGTSHGHRRTLDPRYAKVRSYLTDLFAKAVNDWGLDGVKIDFVDSFIRSEDDRITEGMDYPVLEDAVEELIRGIYERLYAINPDVLIEFRQGYMGPSMRRYANIIRVADCPDDALKNRLGVVNLRLTSGETAVHSDMLMWNPSEDACLAAKQIINILFSVPQISVRIGELSSEHYAMLRFYMSFWIKYRDLLTDTKMIPEGYDSNYSKICANKDDRCMCVCYADNTLNVNADTFIAVNGTSKTEFYGKCDRNVFYRIYNCIGKTVETGKLGKGLFSAEIPVSGVAEFIAVE